MAMRALTCTTEGPARSAVWKMLNEAWGFFSGSLPMSVLSEDKKIRESQVKFSPEAGVGHDHGGGSDGVPLTITGVKKRHFDLNRCNVAWGNYFFHQISSSHKFVALGGRGQTDCQTSISYASGTGNITVNYGVCLIDFDPGLTTTAWTTTQPCQLDIRALDAYNTGFGTSNNSATNVWTILGAYASPAIGGVAGWCHNIMWGFATGGTSPQFRICCNTTATNGVILFDYGVLIRKL